MAPVSRPLQAFLAAIFLACIAAGLLLYVEPKLSADFWPYNMKPLATRMFASLFLGVGLATALALRERVWDSVEVLLVQGASMFGLILLAALINLPDLRLAKAGAVVWLALFSSITLGCLVFLLKGGGRISAKGGPLPALTPLPRPLKFLLWLHTALVVVFGVQMLAAPSLAEEFWPWKLPSIIVQGLGGLFLGTAVGTTWSATRKYWENVKVLFPAITTFVILVLIAVGIHWTVISRESPGVEVTALWLLVYVYAGGYPLYFYIRQP